MNSKKQFDLTVNHKQPGRLVVIADFDGDSDYRLATPPGA